MNFVVYVLGKNSDEVNSIRVKLRAKSVDDAMEKATTHVIASLNYPLYDKYEIASVRKV